jgi:EAL domain-containing protein (putative c-di-GMP-specific phosphodiesterase class I)
MTPIIFCALLAVTLAVGIAIGIAIARFGTRSRASFIGMAIAGFSRAVSATRRGGSPAMAMHQELSEALDRDELVLHYQPKIELGTGRVSALEALVRWRHLERGLLTPAEFVPVAEQAPELIGSLTRWVLRRALADYRAWTAAGNDWMVAVNITAQDVGSLEFAATVGQILGEAGVRPERLRLEVSEVALAGSAGLAGSGNLDVSGQVVAALAGQGIAVAIDDFGTGVTSVSTLRSLAVSEVKIARTFVVGLPGERATVRSLIDLGSSLGCSVTAVGVEWQEVADWLVDAGCDHAQGYLWLRPRDWTEVAQVFGATTATTATTAAATTARTASDAWATESAPPQTAREPEIIVNRETPTDSAGECVTEPVRVR